ncbi:MAG: hypothetical protein KA369_09740 [Spirochaetes bacterium]|nr:hypothetical protein [Spirochaetota bacterium]
MNVNIVRPIVIGMMAISALLAAGCDDLNTGLVKRGYSFLIQYPFSWAHPANLDADNIDCDSVLKKPTSEKPMVVVDSSGNAVITWLSKPDSGNNSIFKSEYRNGRWIHPCDFDNDKLNSATADPIDNHTVSICDNGTAVIAWVQNDYDGTFARLLLFNNGVRGTMETISTAPTEEIASALNANGNGYIVFTQMNGGIYQIYRREIHNGVLDPGSPIGPMSSGPNHASCLQVAIDKQGNAVIAWQQSDGSALQTYMNEYRGASWSGPIKISYSGGDFNGAFIPKVAMSDNGSALVAWQQQTGGSLNRIFYSYYNGSNWDHPASDDDNRLDDAGTGVDGGLSPQIAMDRNGNAVVAWTRTIHGISHIQKADYRNGAWSRPGIDDHIDPDNGSATNPSVAMGGNDAVIAWRQDDGSNYHIYKAEYRNGSWKYPSDLLIENIDSEVPSETSANVPFAAMNNSGETIIVWDQTYGGYKHIYKSEYRNFYQEILPFLY